MIVLDIAYKYYMTVIVLLGYSRFGYSRTFFLYQPQYILGILIETWSGLMFYHELF